MVLGDCCICWGRCSSISSMSVFDEDVLHCFTRGVKRMALNLGREEAEMQALRIPEQVECPVQFALVSLDPARVSLDLSVFSCRCS